MKIKILNEEPLGKDIVKFIKDRNFLKLKNKYSLDYIPIYKKIETEIQKVKEIKKLSVLKLLLIPAKFSFVNTDCYFTFKVEEYNQKTKTITLKYIN